MEDLTQRHKGTENGRAGSLCPPPAPHAPWPRMKLGEVCEILDSHRRPITKKNRVPGEIPYYGATGVVDYVADWLFDERLVLLGEDGAKWGAGDNSAFIIEGKSWVNNHAHVLRPRDQVFDAFLVNYLNFADLSDFIVGVTVPKLNQQRMCEIEIPLPPLPEQRAIVAKLERELAAVDAMEKKFEEMEKTAETGFKAELKEAFEALETGSAPGNGTDGTNGTTATGTNATAVKRDDPAARRPTNVAAVASVSCPSGPSGPRSPSQLPALPAPCRRVKLGEVCELKAGGDKPKIFSRCETEELKVPVVSNGIENDGVCGYTDHATVFAKCVTVSARGTIGWVCVRECPFVPIVRLVVVTPHDSIEVQFLAAYLQQLPIDHTGSSIPQLTVPMIKDVMIPVPDITTQRAIVARLDAARVRKEKLVAAARKGAEAAALLRKALLKEAFE